MSELLIFEGRSQPGQSVFDGAAAYSDRRGGATQTRRESQQSNQ